MSHTPIPADILAASAEGQIPADIPLAFLAESRDRAAVIGIWFVLGLTTAVFALRMLIRLVLRPAPGVDDLLACLTLICYIAFAVLCHILVGLGSARHFGYIQYVLPLQTVEMTEILDFAAHLIYTSALYLCRLSGLAFYHDRIIGRSVSFTWTIRIVAVLLTAAYVPQMLLILLHCIPVTGLWPYDWQPQVERYTCLQWGTVYATNSAISLASDIALFSIPLAIVISLKRLSHSKKVKLAAILMPGVAVIGISVARLVMVIQGQWQPDESWYYGPLLAIEGAEIGSTLLALSAPALHPLFRSWGHRAGRHLSLARSTSNHSHQTQEGYYGNAQADNFAVRWWSSLRTAVQAHDSDSEAEDEQRRTGAAQPELRLAQANHEWEQHYHEKAGGSEADGSQLGGMSDSSDQNLIRR